LVFLQGEDRNGLPTAQQAERNRKERKVERIYLGSAVQSEARYREKGVNWGGLGEWQCEVRWGARRVVARREQGAVGNVSRREWGNFKAKTSSQT
jgi:hypothetical protein